MRRRPISNTLTSYLAGELAKAVGMALLLFSFLLLVGFGYQVLREGASLATMAWVLPAMLPLISPMVLPLAIISGILVAYGRFSADNEFIAAQAGGVRPVTLALPAFLVAAVAVFVTVFLNEFALGPAVRSIQQAVINDQTVMIARKLSRPGTLSHNRGAFYALCRLSEHEDAAGRASIDIAFFDGGGKTGDALDGQWNPERPWPTLRISARDHELGDIDYADGEMMLPVRTFDTLLLQLNHADLNAIRVVPAGEVNERVPLERFGSGGDVIISERRMRYWRILYLHEQRETARRAADDWRRRLIAEEVAAAQGETTLPAPPPDADKLVVKEGETPALAFIKHRVAEEERLFNRTNAELHHKLALSFSCIGFALLGVPLGLRAKQRGVASGFALGTVVALVYFMLQQAAKQQIGNNAMPWWLAWLPDLLLLALAAWYWWRMRRVD